MNTALSDALKETRSMLLGRSRLRLFLMPCEVRKLAKRFNTFIALAEDIEDDLHLHELREHRTKAQHGCITLRVTGTTLVIDRRDDEAEP